MQSISRKLVLLILICAYQPIFANDLPITISFVGDIMLDETPGQIIKKKGDPFLHFRDILTSTDITIGNLECPVSAKKGIRENKPYTFKAHPRVLPLLKKYFSAVSVANNHTYDFGEEVFIDTLRNLEKNKIGYFGGGKNLYDAHKPLIFNIRNKKVALLGYNEFFPRSFEALTDRAGIAWSEDDFVVEGIKNAKSKYGADYVITFPHWGIEHEKIASERQVHLARLMIDSGADAVIGGHPHVTQNIETYKGKPIFYSLGNFVFNGFTDDDSNTGWLVVLTIDKDKISWLVHEAKLNKSGIPKPTKKIIRQN